MAAKKDVIAIDFGTTNTYLTRCPSNARIPTPIQLDASVVGIETAMLYTNESGDISPYIGEQAVNGFGMATPQEREKFQYQFRSHFKPDIQHSEQSRQNARDFFAALLRDAARQNLKMAPLESRVIIGVPSEAGREYRDTLKSIARDAGYGEVELVDEPIGAMLDGISLNMFPLADIISGFLVIDFGGGTCDFAFLKNGRVQSSWGDMHLGGRLFDDLFYRWYCDLNPGREQTLQAEGEDFFVRTYHCRRWKEKFSQYMTHTPGRPFSYVLGEYGKVTGITWDEFLQRASSYVPTESFLRFQAASGAPLPAHLSAKPMNLLHWFRDALETGLTRAGISRADIRVIALAGGSCQWSFVAEYCREVLQNDRFFMSSQPYATIANGLAVLPALEREFAQKQAELTDKLPGFLQSVKLEIARELASSRKRIVAKILLELFDDKLKPILLDFREKGGTILDLEARLGQQAAQFEQRINALVREDTVEAMNTLFAMTLDRVQKWLKENDLRMGEVEPHASFSTGRIDLGHLDPRLAQTIVDTVNTIVGTVIVVIVANICGGGGAAILFSGPLGLIVGALIGVVVAISAAALGKEKATQMAKQLTIPANISPIPGTKINPINPILSDKKIERCRQDMEKDLNKKIENASGDILKDVESRVERVIRDEIARLSIVNL